MTPQYLVNLGLLGKILGGLATLRELCKKN